MPSSFSSFFRTLLNLREGAEDKHVIIDNIKDDAAFSSARFWTLVFAILLCSIGLNINSIPVVIGAMLISPLMGPIVSLGLALATYDWGLMHRSFRNLLTLTLISIFISAVYFAISPINNAQSELLSRIQPTIFDVLVAVFGGMVGFIGLSRARQSTIIPGVAIATAIMPPLCTVGYGIATVQPQFILGAAYLFLINCIFICLSALVVARYLKLPKHEYPSEAKRRRVNRLITVIIVVIVSPAAYLAYTFVDQNNFTQNVDSFIRDVFVSNGHVVIYKNVVYHSSPRVIELAFLSSNFTTEELSAFETVMKSYELEGSSLIIRQDEFSLGEDEWQRVLGQIDSDDEKIQALEARLLSEREAANAPSKLLPEAKAISTKVTDVAVGTVQFAESSVASTSAPVGFIYSETNAPLLAAEADMLTDWLKARLESPDMLIQFFPLPVEEEVFEVVEVEEEVDGGSV